MLVRRGTGGCLLEMLVRREGRVGSLGRGLTMQKGQQRCSCYGPVEVIQVSWRSRSRHAHLDPGSLAGKLRVRILQTADPLLADTSAVLEGAGELLCAARKRAPPTNRTKQSQAFRYTDAAGLIRGILLLPITNSAWPPPLPLFPYSEHCPRTHSAKVSPSNER